jgi:hypothetical protein
MGLPLTWVFVAAFALPVNVTVNANTYALALEDATSIVEHIAEQTGFGVPDLGLMSVSQ